MTELLELRGCNDCIHYKSNDCGDYDHPCPEYTPIQRSVEE